MLGACLCDKGRAGAEKVGAILFDGRQNKDFVQRRRDQRNMCWPCFVEEAKSRESRRKISAVEFPWKINVWIRPMLGGTACLHLGTTDATSTSCEG